MSENKPADDLIGKTVGQFEILQEVGRGGMATVYKARQKSMNRTVAVKVLPRHLLHDPSFYERFEREVDVIAHLEHPHILPIYDYGQADGIPFIAMRFLGGGSLEQRVRRGLSDLEELERPLRQIAQALDYAHQQGIIHRDLKPGNIMLDEDGNAYLSDFGIARVLGSDLTGSMIIGTPAYMSPEQANGLPIDGRSDIYSLGIVLFELMTGKEPYQAETPMAVLLKHINEPVPPVSSFRPDVPPEIEAVIQKATAKNPDERFSAAGDMAKAYSAALRGETATFEALTKTTGSAAAPTRQPAVTHVPGIAAPANMTGQLPQFQTDPNLITGGMATGTMAPPARRGPSMGVLLALVAVVAIVVVGAVLGISMLTPEDKPETPVSTVPTPFPRASTITQDQYTISIPNDWIPPSIVLDQSDNRQMRHTWRADDRSALVTLTLVNAELTGDPIFFRDAVDQYLSRAAYDSMEVLHFVDEATAEDGSIRRSYYLTMPVEGGAENLPEVMRDLASGQLDVFFMQRGSYLVVLEMYTAESTGNTLVPRMQFILDSLRVKQA